MKKLQPMPCSRAEVNLKSMWARESDVSTQTSKENVSQSVSKMVQWDILTKNCANGGADQKSGKCSVRYLSALDESDMFGTH